MVKLSSTTSTFVIASVIATGIAVGVQNMPQIIRAAGEAGHQAGGAVSFQAHAATGSAAPSTANPATPWAASAPGRVEPRNGELRIVSQIPGRIVDVFVTTNDKVKAGDLLFRIDDEEYRAKVEAADAEASVRTRERDNENVGKASKDRRVAEDAVERAQRNLFATRMDLDRVMASHRSGQASEQDVQNARTAVANARAQLDRDRENMQRVIATQNTPLPTRLEAGLSVARADFAMAETMLGRTRVRAPADGTILQVHAKAGEMSSPASELPMIVMGDLSALRVRAEIVERDVDKVRVGQGAVVTSDAFPGRQFEGVVTQVARSLAPPLVFQKGPRRPNDVDVLEVFVELDGNTPLLPGMRADVFFKPEAGAQAQTGQGAGTGQAAPGQAKKAETPQAAAPAPK